jgi:Raf kinase inhibitor-like YbhB/YbcL family protein
MEATANKLYVNSTAFGHNGHIPLQYTCEGENVNPPLTISDIPEGTKSLVLILEDPDAPKGVFYHWLVWDLVPGEAIAENSVPGTVGLNSFGKTAYGGPCPPSGTHRYYFKVYALDTKLLLPAGEGISSLDEAMKDHILAKGELMGRYKRRMARAGD